MKLATSSSLYDSASSRAQAPQAGAAEKSINRGLFWALAWASAASTSLIQLTSIFNTSFQNTKKKSTEVGCHPNRSVTLAKQRVRSKAASTRFALAEDHWLMRRQRK
jgi:hypothetical protein